MIEPARRALELFDEHDSYTAITSLAALPDPVEAMHAFADAMLELYWKRKDLPAAVAFGRAGVQFGLTGGDRLEPTDADLARRLRERAKAMAYNVASFTWPGWDEAGVRPTVSDVAVGVDAARANLRLALELDKGELPLSRGHWMLAGHHLARRDYARAADGYQAAAAHSRAAHSAPDEWLALGFLALTQLLQDPTDAAARERLDEARTRLKALENGEEFLGQIDAASRVFAAQADGTAGG